MSAFSQIVSRIGHQLPSVYDLIRSLIILVLNNYPQQALWHLPGVIKWPESKQRPERAKRGLQIIDEVKVREADCRRRAGDLIAQDIDLAVD
jgi:serine/threonine-protein kinase ATR